MKPSDIKQMIGNAMKGVRQALRGILVQADASKRVILVQAKGLNGETFNQAEMFQQPGFRSNPLPGMQPIIIPLNGSSAASVVVAMSNGTLFITDLAPGETAVFNEVDGVANSVILRNGRIMDIQCDTLNINAMTQINMTTANLNLSVSESITSNAGDWEHAGPLELEGSADISDNLSVGSGATAAITTITGNVVNIQAGIVTNVF